MPRTVKSIGIFLLHLVAIYLSTIQFTAWSSWLLAHLIYQTNASKEFLFDHIVLSAFLVGLFAGTFNVFLKHKIVPFVCLVPIIVLVYKFMIFHATLFESRYSMAYQYYFTIQGLNLHGFSTVPALMKPNEIDFASIQRCLDQFYYVAPVFTGLGYGITGWIMTKIKWRKEDFQNN